MMTGLYPSDSLVYQLQGRVSRSDSLLSLPYLLRRAGYHTSAFVSNPFAYYLSMSVENGFDSMPELVFQAGGLQHVWNATTPLHQDSGFGSRIDEYFDLEHVWNMVGSRPDNLSMRYRPDAVFRHASELQSSLPDGFFPWVHIVTPHNPYLPDAVDRGRFLPANELHTYEEEFGNRWKPHYPPMNSH